MTNQKINDVDTITTFSGTDRLLVNTDVINNVLEQIEKDDFVADIVSSDSGNLLDVGTDSKLAVIDSTITLQSNTFNGNSQLIQTTSLGKYPALDGSLITNVEADLPTSITSNMPTLSNNGSDANNDIDFSAGFCWDLTTNIKITNIALTKRLDASFVEGTNQGGLDTGSKAISTWYHCFAISKADGTADFLFSTSPTAPTMPSGFINKKRIGSISTDSSGNIIGFYQVGNYFGLKNIVQDINLSLTLPTSATLYTLSVPTGLNNIFADINCELSFGTGSSSGLITSPNGVDQTPSASVFHLNCSQANTYLGNYSNYINVNSSAQIRARFSAATAYFRLHTNGWIDGRGVN